jgi:tRNA (guanine37-N1)-methyltransferase
MRIDILSLFPKIAEGALSESILGRAQSRGLASIHSHNLRDWARDKHRVTDDAPYGGGQGMVLKCEPIVEAVESLKTPQSRVIHLSPAGGVFNHCTAKRLAEEASHLILLCGHYEGIDQRAIELLVDEEISIGDYVLTNGALAACVIVDAVVRLLPGVLGDEASAVDDSFATGVLEFPQYTRPVEFRGKRVPEILLSGNHALIAEWRREQALLKTRRLRPDLLPPPSSQPPPQEKRTSRKESMLPRRTPSPERNS